MVSATADLGKGRFIVHEFSWRGLPGVGMVQVVGSGVGCDMG